MRTIRHILCLSFVALLINMPLSSTAFSHDDNEDHVHIEGSDEALYEEDYNKQHGFVEGNHSDHESEGMKVLSLKERKSESAYERRKRQHQEVLDRRKQRSER